MTERLEQLEKKIQSLGTEVNALQIKILSESTPWYQQASTIISLFALIFSFGTTVISYKRSAELDERALKQELRGLIIQLA